MPVRTPMIPAAISPTRAVPAWIPRPRYVGSSGPADLDDPMVKDAATEWLLEPIDPQRTQATYRVSMSSDGLRAAAAFRSAEALVRRHLIDGFADALKARAEQS